MRFLLKFIGTNTTTKILAVSILIAVFDLIGIAIIFPYLKLYTNPEFINEVGVLTTLYSFFEFQSSQQFILYASLGLVLFFILKFYLSYLLNRVRYGINADITRRLSDQLFAMLMKTQYGFLAKSSVSEISGIINAQTIHGTICLESWTAIGTEALFLFLVLATLVVINPGAAAITIFLLLLVTVLLYFFIIKKTATLGKQQANVHLRQYKFLYNIVNGIKDIKIMELEKACNEEHAALNTQYANAIRKFNLYQILPKHVIELLVIGGFLSICIFLLIQNIDVQEIVPVIGFIALSTIRIGPSYGKIIGAYNSFKYYQDSLGLVSGLFATLKENQVEIRPLSLPFEKSVRVQGLSFEYAGKTILSNVNLEIKKSTSVGIVGSSGTGKTTLLDVLVGLKRAKNGRFFLDGHPFDPFTTDALKRHVGYVPQNVTLVDESIAFNISFEIDPDLDRLERATKAARIHDYICSLPQAYQTPVGENGVRLSGGQKQRVGIARALYRDPEILIFDEATSSLDNITEKELTDEINQLSRRKTVVIVAHRLTTVERCDVIHVFHEGNIIASGPHQKLLETCDLYRMMNRKELEERLTPDLREPSKTSFQ